MRLRFTIRDLLWLTALIAMGVGWWLDHRAKVDPLTNQPRVQVYALKKIDSNRALTTAQTMLAGEPSFRISSDSNSNSLIVLARPVQQAQIRDLIEKLENAAQKSE